MTKKQSTYEILKNSILSQPRMMGTDGEKKTIAFLIDYLKTNGLSPRTEIIQWSTAFMEGRKLLYIFIGCIALLFNLTLRLKAPLNAYFSLALIVFSITFTVIFIKALFADKLDHLGKTFDGQNIICDIPPLDETAKQNGRILYFTAHSDTIASNHPQLNKFAMIGLLLGFLLTVLLTLTSSILNLVTYYNPNWSAADAIRILNWIVFAFSVIVFVCAISAQFIRRVNTSPGACDNGSGSAILLSLASQFQQKPLENTHLRFIWCTAEEWGLYGSKGYVQAHKEEITTNNSHSHLINVDMVGSELAYLEKSGLFLRKAMNENLNQIIHQTAQEAKIEVRSFNSILGGNSDHSPFKKEGVEVCFFLANKDSKFIHSKKDIIENVKTEKLDDAVKLITLMANKLDKIE